MFCLEKIVRNNISKMQAYSCAREEYSKQEGVFLNANENPFGKFNRYPDPQQRALKQRLSQLKGISTEQIFIGNGSDEIIDLVFRIFCEPRKDKALIFTPTYSMYAIYAAINDVRVVKTPLTSDFQIDFDALHDSLIHDKAKLLFICSPNNPTGNNIEHIDRVLNAFQGIVVVDEAYIDFSSTDSMVGKVKDYANLVVVQTFSKAWGLAGVRVGVAYASTEIISLLSKVKPPYNISVLNQQVVLNTLNNTTIFERQKSRIVKQRHWLERQLRTFASVKKIYPSEANFLLIEVEDASRIYQELVVQKVITRNRSSMVKNCLRITIGSEKENKVLIKSLKILLE